MLELKNYAGKFFHLPIPPVDVKNKKNDGDIYHTHDFYLS